MSKTNKAGSEQFQKDKTRTPSGTELQNKVSGIRTFFSPDSEEKEVVCPIQNQSQSTETVEPSAKVGTREVNIPIVKDNSYRPSRSTRSSDSKRKQTEDDHDNDQSPKVLKQSCFSIIGKKIKYQTVKKASKADDNDFETFITPPGTPIRRMKQNSETAQDEGATNMEVSPNPEDEQHQKNSIFQTLFKEITEKENDNNDENIVVSGIEDIPETINVKSVHSMFKKLEKQFEERVQKMENQISNATKVKQITDTVPRSEYDKLVQEVKTTKIKNRALHSAVQTMWQEIEDMTARLKKIEINNSKKSIVISGLYTGDEKFEAIGQVQDFIELWFNFKPEIDDLYWIGQNTPRTKVVILQSMIDKAYIMENKAKLKEARNEDRKKIYINNFVLPEDKAKYAKERQTKLRNTEGPEEERVDIQFNKNRMFINGMEKKQITAPSPEDMLDLTERELEKVFDLHLNQGPNVEEEGNIFTAFTAAIRDTASIQNLYLRMRLSYPKSRHIVCAYYIPGKDKFLTIGCCDDGEHEAGTKLLQFLMDNDLQNRVIFVTRHYRTKIGGARFTCMIKAAQVCIMQYPMNEVLDAMQYLLTTDEMEAEWGESSQDEEEGKKKEQMETNQGDKAQINNQNYKQASTRGRGNRGRGGSRPNRSRSAQGKGRGSQTARGGKKETPNPWTRGK